jgi:hypothetical protein
MTLIVMRRNGLRVIVARFLASELGSLEKIGLRKMAGAEVEPYLSEVSHYINVPPIA